MRLRYILLTLFFLSTCGFLLTACEGPPDDAVFDAEDAIKKAIEAGAEDGSPKLLDDARTHLQDAKMFREQGKYKEARDKAEIAVIRAEKAEKNANRLAVAHGEIEEEPPAEPAEEAAETEKTE